MSANQSPFTELVSIPSTQWSDQVNTNDRKSISDALRANWKRLKIPIRRYSISPAHPIRSSLWPVLISKKLGVSFPVSKERDPSHLPALCDNSQGFDLSDQGLLPTYYLTNDGQACLRTVLHSIAVAHPEIVYAPQLWPLVALFLHYHDITVTQQCVLALIEHSSFLVSTKSGWKEHCLALEFLGRAGFVPRLALRPWRKHAKAPNLPNPRHSLIKWPFVIWQLPFEFIVRLIDCYLLEGPKVFYRAGLVLWALSAKQAKNNSNSTPSFDLRPEVMHATRTPNNLLKLIFSIARLSRSDIDKAIRSVKRSEDLMNDSVLDQLVIHPCAKGTLVTYTSYDTASYIHPSEIVTPNELASLVSSIRDKHLAQLCKPILIFSSNRDGTSLRTLYQRAAEAENPASILLVRSSSGRSVIGAFCSERWHIPSRPSFYGTGLSYLFRLRPGPFAIYAWIGAGTSEQQHQHFQFSTMDSIEVGGSEGRSYSGLSLNGNLSICTSGPSPTFDNPCLIGEAADKITTFGEQNEAASFNVSVVELIGFQDL